MFKYIYFFAQVTSENSIIPVVNSCQAEQSNVDVEETEVSTLMAIPSYFVSVDNQSMNYKKYIHALIIHLKF